MQAPVATELPRVGRMVSVNAGSARGDRTVHGGADKAVYAYAAEDYAFWRRELALEVGPGTFGDNLTVWDIDLNSALVGERWRVGSALLEVSQPRIPCYKLGIRMAAPEFPMAFGIAARWGAYLRVVVEGEIGAGDRIQRVFRPDHRVTVGPDRCDLLRRPQPGRRAACGRRAPSRLAGLGRQESEMTPPRPGVPVRRARDRFPGYRRVVSIGEIKLPRHKHPK